MPSGFVNTPNVSSAGVIPSPVGCYQSVQNGPGPGTVTIQVDNANGTFALHVGSTLSNQGFVQVPDTSIVSEATGATGAITANGKYTVTVGAGTVYVYNGAGSGSCTVTLSSGLSAGDTPGTSGGGSNVNATIVGPSNLLTPSDGLNETFQVVATIPTALPSHVLTGQYAILRAPSTNVAPVMWGYVNNIGSAIAVSNHASFILPGGAASVNITNTNLIYYNSINSTDLLVVEAA